MSKSLTSSDTNSYITLKENLTKSKSKQEGLGKSITSSLVNVFQLGSRSSKARASSDLGAYDNSQDGHYFFWPLNFH
jgi:hypothetical protein